MNILPIYLLLFWFSIKLLQILFEIPFSKHSYHIKTGLPIYITNQLPSFHMTQSLLRRICVQAQFSNKNCVKYIHLIFRFLNITY